MRAFAVTPGAVHSAAHIEQERPRPCADEYLVRVLDVGIDATDKEIDAGEYGAAPEGESVLVLGHEALGVIEEAATDGGSGGADDDTLNLGDLVVPTVRRPCPERCPPCANGFFDFCATGNYTERGIKQAHGYLVDAFVERAEFLVRVPQSMRTDAVLLEPISIVEKVFRQSDQIQARLPWRPQRLVVAGAGSIGMIAAMLGRLRGLDTLLYSKGPATGAVAAICDATATDYVNADDATLADVRERFGAADLFIEATGYSPLVWQAADCLAVNGVLCLLSVTGGDLQATIPSDRLNLEMVLGNRLIFGSVSSHRLDFEAAAEDVQTLRTQWPTALDAFVTRRIPFAEVRSALDEDETGVLKLVIAVNDE